MSDLVQRLAGVRLEGIEELCWDAADRIEQLEAALAAADALAARFDIALHELDEYNVESSGENCNCPKHNAALAAYREARNQTGRPE